jgi:hypothetical protein
MDFVGGEQVVVLAVAETTFRALELPEGLIDHATHLLDASTPQVRISVRVAQGVARRRARR